jgi:hypothetical protein
LIDAFESPSYKLFDLHRGDLHGPGPADDLKPILLPKYFDLRPEEFRQALYIAPCILDALLSVFGVLYTSLMMNFSVCLSPINPYSLFRFS